MRKFLIIALLALTFNAHAQIKNLLSEFNLPSDTVVNGATQHLTVQSKGDAQTTTIQAVVTKISGTVAGTLSLHGSLDGINFSSIDTLVHTATDVASQNFFWLLKNSPVLYYRVSYTGSGTMEAVLSAKLLAH